MRPLLVGKKCFNSYEILPNPKPGKYKIIPAGLCGKEYKEYLIKEKERLERKKLIERVLKIEKLRSKINTR